MQIQGDYRRIAATDGFDPEVYCVIPDRARAGLICVMEAFGVNAHIQRLAHGFAAAGYAVLAPALYDRIGRRLCFDYDAGRPAAVAAMRANGFDHPLADVAGCVQWLRGQGIDAIGILGYCYGGTVSWLAASRIGDIRAACCYYGSAIPTFADAHPLCPTIAHWGKADPSTPSAQVEAVAAANPAVTMYWYEAGHGFNSDDRLDSFNAAASTLARERTLAFFKQYLPAENPAA